MIDNQDELSTDANLDMVSKYSEVNTVQIRLEQHRVVLKCRSKTTANDIIESLDLSTRFLLEGGLSDHLVSIEILGSNYREVGEILAQELEEEGYTVNRVSILGDGKSKSVLDFLANI
jgi:hypothetical protein